MNEPIFRYSTPVILFGGAPVAPAIIPFLSGLVGLPVLAADGGLHSALAAGFHPIAVIGDMDSLDTDADLPPDIEMIQCSGQDDTDFEKSLARIAAPLIIGVGFLDGRFDHALAVMDVLSRPAYRRPVLLLGGSDVMLRCDGDCQLSLPAGTRLSVWPLWQQAFHHSSGLDWPLDGLILKAGMRIGTSNRVSDGSVTLKAAAGDGYVVIAPVDCFEAMLAAATATFCLPEPTPRGA
jgi:thiamine pyrophosphokinase